jgi:nicotinamidase-related amidase
MKQLLLVIDLQDGWRHNSATEPAMLRTVSLCQSFTGKVIHCCFKNEPTSSFHNQLGWRRFVGSPDTDAIPEIVPLKLPVYWRTTYSCVTKELLPILKDYDHIYLAGVFTDISVFVTALEIFDLGIPVSVVKDCVATLHGDQAHRSALHSLDFAIGTQFLVNASDV